MLPIRDNVPRRNPPIATWTLILVNGVVFLFELTMPPDALEQFVHLFGIVPARYTHPDWASWVGFPIDNYWPFFTSMFLHAGWLHIIGNMWALWIFGDNVEDRMGPIRFTVFYVLCGLVSGVVHWFTNADSTLPTVGASGAIAGVMGAYFFLFPRARVVVLFPVLFLPLFFELPAVTYLGFWVLIQVFSGTLSVGTAGEVGGVAWWAHVGGFVSGIALQFFFVRSGRGFRLPSPDGDPVEAAWLPSRQWRAYR
jgi:membrane associated rhomboid family serine protease